MSTVGVLHHQTKPRAATLAEELEAWLNNNGHKVVASPSGPEGLDLLVVLGGDGTMLRGVALAGFAGVPILGVNLGRLGFLTEATVEGATEALARALAGDCTIDERSTVHASILRSNGTEESLGEAINEASIERAVGGKIIRMSISIGDQPFTSQGADGIIIATPTGSTAYAFSMRGPVVSPDLRCLIVVAVGAHSLFDHPVVVAEQQPVRITLTDRGSGVVVMDGHPRTEMSEGDVLLTCIGPSTVKLVRLGPDSHFTRVAQRFGFRDV